MTEQPEKDKRAIDAVMQRIECGQVKPTPRGWFTCMECVVHMFWLVTVLIGALAVAILAYTAIHGWYGFHEASGLSRVGLVFAYVPVLWVLVLVLTVGLAYRNVRQTKHGYRYPLWLVLLGSVGASALGGMALYSLGFAHVVDTKLGEEMPLYQSYYKQQELFWQAPAENRWLGTVATSADMVFADIAGVRWELNVAEIGEVEHTLLLDGRTVRLLGVRNATGSIMVCAVLPWHADKPMPVKTLAADRSSLVEKLHSLKQASSTCARMGVLEQMP